MLTDILTAILTEIGDIPALRDLFPVGDYGDSAALICLACACLLILITVWSVFRLIGSWLFR